MQLGLNYRGGPLALDERATVAEGSRGPATARRTRD
jgi:hypothetical protein